MNVENFRPSEVADYWTLSTAIAWVATRSFDGVERVAPNGAFDLGEYLASPGAYQDAANWLIQRLTAGVIEATGASNRNGGDRLAIEQEEWLVAQTPFDITDHSLQHYVHIARVGNRLQDDYRDVRVSKTNVLQWFPIRIPFIDSEAEIVTRSATELEEVSDMPMGEAVLWTLCRGKKIVIKDYNSASSNAERELFDKIHQTKQEVTGNLRPGASRTIALPGGIWARMNKGKHDDGVFVGMDSEHGEVGGTVYWDGKIWTEVCIPSAFVLQHWPPEGDAKPALPADAASVNSGDPSELAKFLFQKAVTEQGRIGVTEFNKLCQMNGITTQIAYAVHKQLATWGRGRPRKADLAKM